jgi:hypothetical protein
VFGVGRAAISFNISATPARTAMSFREAFVRADIRSHSAEGGRGNMVKHLRAGLVAAAFFAMPIVAHAADLSMTPIYKGRPTTATATTPNDALKEQYRPVGVRDPSRFNFQPTTGATDSPPNGRVFWAGVNDRF